MAAIHMNFARWRTILFFIIHSISGEKFPTLLPTATNFLLARHIFASISFCLVLNLNCSTVIWSEHRISAEGKTISASWGNASPSSGSGSVLHRFMQQKRIFTSFLDYFCFFFFCSKTEKFYLLGLVCLCPDSTPSRSERVLFSSPLQTGKFPDTDYSTVVRTPVGTRH